MNLPNRSRTSTTKWNLFFHYVSIAIMMVMGVLLVPLYLKFIPLNLYGAWLATGNILTWITTIDPGLSTLLQQRVGTAYGQKNFKAIQELLVGGVGITIVIVIFINIFGVISVFYLPVLLNLPSSIDTSVLMQAFSLSVVGTSLMIFSFTITSINQGILSSLGIGIIFVSVNVLGIVLIIILLYSGYGLLAIPIATLFRGVFLTLGNSGYLIWRIIKEKIGFSFSFHKVPELAKLMLYTFGGRVSSVISNNVDLFIVARFLGPEVVPVLHLTRSAPEISRMFVERPPIAFMPAISNLVGAGEIEKAKAILLRLMMMVLWLIGLLIGGFVAFNDDFVRLWVGEHLFAGGYINLIICGVLLFAVINSSLANLCFALGNIKGNSLVLLIQSLLFIPLVFLGAKYLGLVGVVLAPLISMLLVSTWYFPRSFSKLLKLTIQEQHRIAKEIIKVLLVIVPLTLVFSHQYPKGWFHFVVVTGGFCIIYCIGLTLISKQFRLEAENVFKKFRIFKPV